MNDLIRQIQSAQIRAGEAAVISHLEGAMLKVQQTPNPVPASHIRQNCRALQSSLPTVLDAIADNDMDFALEWITNMQSQLRGLQQMLTRAKQGGVDEGA